MNVQARWVLVCAAVWLPSLAWAAGAHQHGVVSLDVTLDAKTLTLQVEAPLDSLVGFEHRPRTPAQRQAADAVVKRVNDGATLFKPDTAAMCRLGKSSVNADALQPAAAGAKKEAEHADLDASYEFTCEQPEKLTDVQIGLFDAFKRIKRVEVQLALPRGQSKQTLKRGQNTLRLTQ
jgi:hypothetical protein